MTTDVNTPSEEYKKAAALWALPRTLMGGTKAMRAAGILYLPQEQAESSDAYKARLTRSTLFNGFKKTVKDMTDKVFRKEIALGDDVPDQLKPIAENVDNSGRHLDVFGKDAFTDAMVPGIGYILAEMPPPLAAGTGRNGEVTKADELAQNRRPYLCYIKREDVLGWKSSIINGQPVLTQIRIKESVKIDDGAFGTKDVPQVRVLYPGKWEIWREIAEGTDKGKWAKVEDGVTSLSYIPIAPIYINRTGFMEGEPPLEDLADLNVAHWQSQSDQKNILHVARVPILAMFGFSDDDTVEIGASRAVRTSSPDADMKYVEHTGAAIGAGDTDLKNLEFQMQTCGLQLLMPKPGGESATGALQDDDKENSSLAMMARALQDALEQAFGFMADYLNLGQDKGGSLSVNRDYGITAAAASNAPQIIDMFKNKLIDRETAIAELQRLEVISTDKKPDEIAAAAENEAADELTTNVPPGGGMDLAAS